MDRRGFVKQSCFACMAIAAGLVVTELSSCATIPAYKAAIVQNKIAVPVSLFAQSNLQIIQAHGLNYNIGLQKEGDGSYTALLLRCTHADNPLVVTGNGYHCNLHGSTFDKEGHVTNGPAERNLKAYKTEVSDNQIIIHLS
jgi:Rieske Fe-S protein